MDGDWKDKDYTKHYNTLYATSAKEFGSYIDTLKLNNKDTLIDFGCGNGDFIFLAANKAKYAVGVDISEPQAAQAKEKVKNFKNAEIVLSSFLEYKPNNLLFTKAFSRKALHHLTNPEKEQFLLNISTSFAKDAIFLLEDGIFFDFPRSEIEKKLPELIADASRYYGSSWEAKKKDILHSFTQEFPAGASEWESFFNKAGFTVIQKIPKCSFYGTIIAKKG